MLFRYYLQVGFTNDGKVLAYDLEVYNNGGNSLDLSQAVLEIAMFNSDNVYEIPHVRIRGNVCFTNYPSNTAFRGFGGPQGMLITENWIQRIAAELNRSPEEIIMFLKVHRNYFSCFDAFLGVTLGDELSSGRLYHTLLSVYSALHTASALEGAESVLQLSKGSYRS